MVSNFLSIVTHNKSLIEIIEIDIFPKNEVKSTIWFHYIVKKLIKIDKYFRVTNNLFYIIYWAKIWVFISSD